MVLSTDMSVPDSTAVMLTLTVVVGSDVSTTVYVLLPPSGTANSVGSITTAGRSSSFSVILATRTIRSSPVFSTTAIPSTSMVSSPSATSSSCGVSVSTTGAVPISDKAGTVILLFDGFHAAV